MTRSQAQIKACLWQIVLAFALLAAATALYGIQVAIFRRGQDTFFYLLQDIAFVPVQVLLVTVIVDRLLRVRERQALVKKLNMVIGAFFSEVGTKLLSAFVTFDPEAGALRESLAPMGTWTEEQFDRAVRTLAGRRVGLDGCRGDLAELKAFLEPRRAFLLGLLENPNLLEHETFTELLWAVFHLMEELSCRSDVRNLAPPDREHIAADISRAYVILVSEWLSYVKHLRKEYPYLFSLAVRTNPFDPSAAVEVR